VCSC